MSTPLGLGRLKEWVPPAVRRRYGPPLADVRWAARRLSCALRPPPRPQTDELYLHLGCGPVNHPKFVNVDAMPYPHVHYARGLEDLSPIATGSAALVYACHCLEHFPQRDIAAILTEWGRVLRPGGILRLSVPDFDRLLAIYRTYDDVATIQAVLMGAQDSRYNYHKAVFTARSLGDLLVGAGFHDVREWTPGSSDLTTFQDWSARKVPIHGVDYAISLNLEAVK
jgi:predicted SAM-dependent methyltransferase